MRIVNLFSVLFAHAGNATEAARRLSNEKEGRRNTLLEAKSLERFVDESENQVYARLVVLYFSPLSAMRAKLQSTTSEVEISREIPRISLAMPISSSTEASAGMPVSE